MQKKFCIALCNAIGKACAIAFFALLFTGAVTLRPAVAQTCTVVHTFTGDPDGTNPNAMIRDAKGNLYGTTYGGGDSACNGHSGACGTIFKIDPAGDETVLFNFPGGNGGSSPVAPVTEDAAGNLYGTTEGDGFLGASVVYKVTPSGQETFFDGIPQSLDSPVALDAQGNIYGMAPFGGTPNCGWNRNDLGCGTLFKLTPEGKLTTLHTFTGTDGMQPEGGMVFDAQGNLYGGAFAGGIRSCRTTGYGTQYDDPGCGVIFKLDTRGEFTILHTFAGNHDGGGPLGLIIDSEGNLYGLTQNGGDNSANIYGLGVIFKIDASGNYSVLYTFTPPLSNSAGLANLPVRDSKGNLYGAKRFDGANNTGYLFRLDTAGNFADLYDFDEQTDGFNTGGFYPTSVVLGLHDDIYGSMYMGGDFGFGTVFHITP